jgi:hypothetical protein
VTINITSVAGQEIVTLRPGDADFTIRNGFSLVSRAGIEFDSECPKHYQELVAGLIQFGLITPVAYVEKSAMVYKHLVED